MKVKEVIEALQDYDPESSVLMQTRGERIEINQVSPMLWDRVGEDLEIMPVISDSKETGTTMFGGLCGKLRAENELSLRDVANALGVSIAKISSIESGRMPLSWSLMIRICEFMGNACNISGKERDLLYFSGRRQVDGIIEWYTRLSDRIG